MGAPIATKQGGTGVTAAPANQVFAGPASGASAPPGFRALVAADLPAGSAGSAFVDPPQGRLTLASGTPVMTSAVSGAGTVYYTPYVCNLCPLWNGSTFVPTAFTELSQVLSDTTNSPSAAAAGGVYDYFVWSKAGTPTLSRGPNWSAGATAGSGTARGSGAGSTALTRVNGVWVNAVDIANGPKAGYGTYVGTDYLDASGATVSWSLGSDAAGGGPAALNVWNAYNRVTVAPLVRDTSNPWTYSGSAWRYADGSPSNGITFVRGLNEDGVLATNARRLYAVAASGYGYVGLGLNSGSALAAGATQGFGQVAGGQWSGTIASTYSGLPGIGAYALYAIEQGDGSNSNQFFGAPSGGLSGSFRA